MEDATQPAIEITLSKEEAEFIVSLMDVAAQRGAIHGNEMFAVGQVRQVIVQKIAELA